MLVNYVVDGVILQDIILINTPTDKDETVYKLMEGLH